MAFLPAKRCMALRSVLLLACGMILLSGCSGGTLGNLIPLPKALSGDVRSGVYYAKSDFFSIDSPFPQHSDLYTYAEIEERYKNGCASVVFHSSVAGNEYYHVEVERLPGGGSGSIDLETAADNAIANIQKMQSSGGREPFVLVKEEEWNAKYTSGLIRLYTQKVPGKNIASDGGKEFYTAYNLMYITKESGKIAVVLADLADRWR